jgi:hypothetical protein
MLKAEYDREYDPTEVKITEAEYQGYLKRRPFWFRHFRYTAACLLIWPFLSAASVFLSIAAHNLKDNGLVKFVGTFRFAFIGDMREYVVLHSNITPEIDSALFIFDTVLKLNLLTMSMCIIFSLLSIRVIDIFWVRFGHYAVYRGNTRVSRRQLNLAMLIMSVVGYLVITNIQLQTNTAQVQWLIANHTLIYISLISFVSSGELLIVLFICLRTEVFLYRRYRKIYN